MESTHSKARGAESASIETIDASVLAELDELRSNVRYKVKLTDEQYEAVKYARSGDTPVSWSKLAPWFSKKFYRLTRDTLKTRFEDACKDRGHDENR